LIRGEGRGIGAGGGPRAAPNAGPGPNRLRGPAEAANRLPVIIVCCWPGGGSGRLTALANRFREGSKGAPRPRPPGKLRSGNSSTGGVRERAVPSCVNSRRDNWLDSWLGSTLGNAWMNLETSVSMRQAHHLTYSHISPLAHCPRNQNRQSARSTSWLLKSAIIRKDFEGLT
jgi:hypothetical protein